MSLPDKKSQSWVSWLSSPMHFLHRWVYPQPSLSPLIKEEYPKQVVTLRTPGRYTLSPSKILENYAPTRLPEFKEEEKNDMS